MLHLVRNLKDEGITIIAPTGEKLKFYVTEIKYGCVTLSFDHFDKFGVWRSEVLTKMQKEKDANITKVKILPK